VVDMYGFLDAVERNLDRKAAQNAAPFKYLH
jgi:hypothetical protein